MTAHCSDCAAWSALGKQLLVDTTHYPALLNITCMTAHQQCRRAWFPAPADARRHDKAEWGGWTTSNGERGPIIKRRRLCLILQLLRACIA